MSQRRVKKLYESYVDRLADMFLRLRETYNKYLRTCVISSDRNGLGLSEVEEEVALLK